MPESSLSSPVCRGDLFKAISSRRGPSEAMGRAGESRKGGSQKTQEINASRSGGRNRSQAAESRHVSFPDVFEICARGISQHGEHVARQIFFLVGSLARFLRPWDARATAYLGHDVNSFRFCFWTQ